MIGQRRSFIPVCPLFNLARARATVGRREANDLDTTTPIPGYKMALAGSMAGGIAGFLGNPAELIMVRMQADKAKPEGRKCLPLISHICLEPNNLNARFTRTLKLMVERFNYRNSIQGLARMTREEGISSWARGIAPNTVRAILMNMSQLAR
jgi:dicarboxylate transporter 10